MSTRARGIAGGRGKPTERGEACLKLGGRPEARRPGDGRWPQTSVAGPGAALVRWSAERLFFLGVDAGMAEIAAMRTSGVSGAESL